MPDTKATKLDNPNDTNDPRMICCGANGGGASRPVWAPPFFRGARSWGSTRMTGTSAMTFDGKAIPTDVLDDLLTKWDGTQSLPGDDGLLKAMTAALVERGSEAEARHHLGHERDEAPPNERSNRRAGRTTKTVRTTRGPVDIRARNEITGASGRPMHPHIAARRRPRPPRLP